MSSKEPEGPLSQQFGRLRSAQSVGDLTGRQRTVLAYVGVLLVVVAVHTLVYWYGMVTFENEPQTFSRSLVTVTETFTTIGYGGDSPWRSTFMNFYVVWLQLVGLAITLVTLRLLIIPLFERAPVVLDTRLTDKDGHVVVCGYERGGVLLLDELDRLDSGYVLVNPDKQEAIDLSNRGYQVIDGDPTTGAALSRAAIADASVVVADAGERNVNVALTVRQNDDANGDDGDDSNSSDDNSTSGDDGSDGTYTDGGDREDDTDASARLVCLTDRRSQRAALEAVGADRSVCSPAIVGRRLGARTAPTIDPEDSAATLDELVVRELTVGYNGPLRGATIGETRVGEHSRLAVVAAWIDGDFRFPPAPTDRLSPGSVLVAIGPEAAFDEAIDGVHGVRSPRAHTETVVIGTGESATAAIEALPEDTTVTTVGHESHARSRSGPESESRSGSNARAEADSDADTKTGTESDMSVDLTGDPTDPTVLTAAGLTDATACVVTVEDDDTALIVVALAQSLAADVSVFVHVSDAENVRKALDAGADYVLSEQRVIAGTVPAAVRGEETVSPIGSLRLLRVSGDHFAGRTIAESDRPADGEDEAVPLGVERNGRFHADGTTEIEADDSVVVAGTVEAIERFERDEET